MARNDPAQASLHATVTGRVQGVYFRAFVEQHAQRLGLAGCVRNIPYSGGVEVEAEGDRDRLEELVRCLHEGPRAASVEKVDVRWGDFAGRFTDFRITF